MLQLKNNTPFEPTISVFPNKDGVDTLYAVIKATFTLGDPVRIAGKKKQVKPILADVHWGEPGVSSLKYTSDLHIGKPGTDVALVGQAWSPGGSPVTELDTAVVVAERRKMIRVVGNRVFKNGLLGLSSSPPEPFKSMPLVYERAFGGMQIVDEEKGKIVAEARNPVGVGLKGKRSSKELEGKLLPNLEAPGRPYKGPTDKYEPVCYAFIAASWAPRLQYAGTYDEAWQKKRAPFLPEDFDPRFLNSAHPDLTFDRFLQGGEQVQLVNLSRRGTLRFSLPRCEIRIEVLMAGRPVQLQPKCETILFEPDEDRMTMTWRGELPCDKKMLKVEEIRFSVGTMGGAEAD